MNLMRELLDDLIDLWLRERWPAYLSIALALALWAFMALVEYAFEALTSMR